MARIVADQLSPRGMGTTAGSVAAGNDSRAHTLANLKMQEFCGYSAVLARNLRDSLAAVSPVLQTFDSPSGTTLELDDGPATKQQLLVFVDQYLTTDFTYSNSIITFPTELSATRVEVRVLRNQLTLFALDQLAARTRSLTEDWRVASDQQFVNASLLDPRQQISRNSDATYREDNQMLVAGPYTPVFEQGLRIEWATTNEVANNTMVGAETI